MEISLEISLYPLQDKYEDTILDFIRQLNQNKKIIVETNGMSTQVFGEYDEVIGTVQTEMKKVYEKTQAILVMKMGRGQLRVENKT